MSDEGEAYLVLGLSGVSTPKLGMPQMIKYLRILTNHIKRELHPFMGPPGRRPSEGWREAGSDGAAPSCAGRASAAAPPGPARTGQQYAPGCATLRVAGGRQAATGAGRLAQRESASFTPRRSVVRSHHRPRVGPSCLLAFGHLRGGPRCLSGGDPRTPRLMVAAGGSTSAQSGPRDVSPGQRLQERPYPVRRGGAFRLFGRNLGDQLLPASQGWRGLACARRCWWLGCCRLGRDGAGPATRRAAERGSGGRSRRARAASPPSGPGAPGRGSRACRVRRGCRGRACPAPRGRGAARRGCRGFVFSHPGPVAVPEPVRGQPGDQWEPGRQRHTIRDDPDPAPARWGIAFRAARSCGRGCVAVAPGCRG
jgi:hypothetical protein